MERLIETVVLILLAMFSVRALVSLVAPALHQRIVARFYRRSPGAPRSISFCSLSSPAHS
jgi:hypothetical protein